MMKQPMKDTRKEGKGGDDLEVAAAGRGTRKKRKEQKEGKKKPQEIGRRDCHLSRMWVSRLREAQVGLC